MAVQLSCLVSALLSVSVHSIRRIDRHPAHVQPGRPRGLLSNPIRDIFRFVSRRRSQNGNKRFSITIFFICTQLFDLRFYQPKQKGLVSPGPKEKRGLIPITLPNFIYLDAEQMPGYEKFEKHEIVR